MGSRASGDRGGGGAEGLVIWTQMLYPCKTVTIVIDDPLCTLSWGLLGQKHHPLRHQGAVWQAQGQPIAWASTASPVKWGRTSSSLEHPSP